MKLLAIIQGCKIFEHRDGWYSMIADADIDCDGSGGNPDFDRYFKPETSLKQDGVSLNAYTEAFMVLPPVAITSVAPMVLGCQCSCYNRETGLLGIGVVGDVGPRVKVGELSVEMARRIGLPSNPNTGGTSNFDQIMYRWKPGAPAIANGKTYSLQRYR